MVFSGSERASWKAVCSVHAAFFISHPDGSRGQPHSPSIVGLVDFFGGRSPTHLVPALWSGASRSSAVPKEWAGRVLAADRPRHPLGLLISSAGDSFRWAFGLCAGNRFLPLSLEESGAKNRPFLMLNCVSADGCFGQCDPPRRAHSQPGFRRLTPAPFVARYRALALKKRPPKEKRKKHSLAAKRHQFLKVGTGIV